MAGRLADFNSPPDENWHWVTSEPWMFVNWFPGEPNDAGGEERYLQTWGFTTPGYWNDDANDTDPLNVGGYLVEYQSTSRPFPSRPRSRLRA